MQITQGASLDTLQLLSSQEALQSFKVGQILKVRVIQGTPPEHGGGRALLEIAGRQHEVRSLTPLHNGQTLQARIEKVGNRLLLQPVTPETGKTAHTSGTKVLANEQTLIEQSGVHRLIQVALRSLLPRQQPVQAAVELARSLRIHPQFQHLQAPLQESINRLLNQRPDAPRPDSRTLRQAIENSGIYLESRLAAPAPEAANRAQGDLKANLLQLLQQLEQLEGGIQPSNKLPEGEGDELDLSKLFDLLRASSHVQSTKTAMESELQPMAASRNLSDRPLESLLRQLFQLSEGALARTTAQQVQQLQNPPHLLQVEIPWLTPWGTVPLRLEIEQKREEEKETDSTPVWSVQLAITLPRLGALQSRLELQDGQLNMQVWAEKSHTVQMLQQNENLLNKRMQALGLHPGPLMFHAAPLAEQNAPEKARQHLLDLKA